jgi:FeS assembly SUF system protein
MTKMEPVADKEMVENALGGADEYDALAQPPDIRLDDDPIVVLIVAALKEIYDPEIPVNIYELGLIYKIEVTPVKDGENKETTEKDIFVEMTLTSPGCPVAQEMPGWVQGAIFPIEGVRHCDVEIVWEPPWDPSKMAETAKLQLNMFT